jgi:hypothetical protein
LIALDSLQIVAAATTSNPATARIVWKQSGGPALPHLVLRVLNRSDFRNRIAEFAQRLGRQADITVLRGVIALEAGNIPRAREAFRAALTFRAAPPRRAIFSPY